jgi:hypothetical protein
MNKNNRKVANEKSVMVVRKKAGKGSAPSSLTQLTAHHSAPAQQAIVPATLPQPLAEPLQPVPSQPSVTPAIVNTGLSKTAQEKQARRELLDVLRDRWPRAFPRDYRQVRPLALGISRDIATHLPEQPCGRISSAIGIFQYLTGPAYFRAVLRGGHATAWTAIPAVR